MFQYLVFLVLLASGKFSHEGLHVIDHKKNFRTFFFDSTMYKGDLSISRFKKLTSEFLSC